MVDLREYPEIFGRLVEGPALSSSVDSGAARFFPFGSWIGSFIARVGGVRRVLNNIDVRHKRQRQIEWRGTNRFEERDDS